MNVDSSLSRQVDLPRGVGPRHSHTATVVSSGPRSVMVVEVGGDRRLFGDIVAATTIVQIGGCIVFVVFFLYGSMAFVLHVY